jgi:hypothetical protein
VAALRRASLDENAATMVNVITVKMYARKIASEIFSLLPDARDASGIVVKA